MSDVNDDRTEVDALREECARLRAENAKLKAQLQAQAYGPPTARERASSSRQTVAPVPETSASDDSVTSSASVTVKLALFGRLFSGREDVYAVRWQNKSGRSGYSPACAHEWDRSLCGKPTVKCGECPNRALLPMTNDVVRDHLTGKHVVGVYPLLPDESCRFLALDFDKAEWQQDVTAFTRVCALFDVPAYIEVSRSGCGAHVWLFFSQAIPAAQARRLGCALLTRTTARRHEVGLDSYDRLFPSQDTLPQGGLGNLIVLPLQRDARDAGRSVFVDDAFRPIGDQWRLLSGVRRMTATDVERALAKALSEGDVLGERIPAADDAEQPWALPPSGRRLEYMIEGPFPGAVDVVRGQPPLREQRGVATTHAGSDRPPGGLRQPRVLPRPGDAPADLRKAAAHLLRRGDRGLHRAPQRLPRRAAGGARAPRHRGATAGRALRWSAAGRGLCGPADRGSDRGSPSGPRPRLRCLKRRHGLRQDGHRRLAHRRAPGQHPCARAPPPAHGPMARATLGVPRSAAEHDRHNRRRSRARDRQPSMSQSSSRSTAKAW